MVTRIGGSRKNSRDKLKKNIRRKGKISISNYFQKFEIGESVRLLAEPAVQKGLYCLRFYNKVGKVVGMQGSCYNIKIVDGKKNKEVLAHPVHLRKVKA